MTAPPDFEALACEVMYSPVGTKKVEAALRSAYAAGAAAERERCADLAHPQRWIGTTCGAPAALEVVRDCIRGVSNPAEPAAHPATGSAEVEAPKRCACGLMLGRSGTCPRCQPEPARPLTLEEDGDVHELKTWPEPFDAILRGVKRFEFRKDDRWFDVGDILRLREWSQNDGYTGRSVDVRVTYLLAAGFGIPPGYVVMSIAAEKGEVPR